MTAGVACFGPNCGGSKYEVTSYDLTEVEAGIQPSTGIKSFYNSTPLQTDDSIKFEDAGFKFIPAIQMIAIVETAGLFTSVFACEPAFLPTKRIVDITVVSSSDFFASDTTYKAGANINLLFNVEDYNYVGPMKEFLDDLPLAHDTPLLLILDEAPAQAEKHSFTFTIKMDDGSNFSLTSKSMILLP
jgi:hypothetical protein